MISQSHTAHRILHQNKNANTESHGNSRRRAKSAPATVTFSPISAHIYDGSTTENIRDHLSPAQRSLFDEFQAILSSTTLIQRQDLIEWVAFKASASAKATIALTVIRAMCPYVSASPRARVYNMIIAIDWMAAIDEVFALKALKKTDTETYDFYIARMRATLNYAKSHGVSRVMIESMQTIYASELASPYLPTQHFKEFLELPNIDLTEVFWNIFNDPYPRSEQEWKTRLETANALFGEDIDIPSMSYIRRTNQPPSVPSKLPLKSQILPPSSMMKMVREWNAFNFKTIANPMRFSETPLRDKLGGVLHGMLQFMATEGIVKPNDKYPILYRGIRSSGSVPALDEYFPIESDGKRKVLKEKSFISTSWNPKVARTLYAEMKVGSSSSSVNARGLLMHIVRPAPFVLLGHTEGQDEALLLPGVFTFVRLLETTKAYDVIEVKYKPDFTLMKQYPGVYEMYKKKLRKD